MYEIRIDLANAASLAPMAIPAGAGGVAALPGGIPVTPGIYVIYNPNSQTRYAGIAVNLQTRFTQRMRVVNELGFTTADMTPIWAWWGTISVRRWAPPVDFPHALAAYMAGGGADLYAPAAAGTAPSAMAAMPLAPPAGPAGAPGPGFEQIARNRATLPMELAAAAYQAYNAGAAAHAAATAAGLGAAAATAARNATFAAIYPPPAAAGWPGGVVVAAAAALQILPNAQAAAALAAQANGAPPAVVAQTVAAVDHYFGAGGAVPASEVQRTVHALAGGPALPAPAAPTPLALQNPVHVGANTHLNFALPGAVQLNLEAVLIRYVLQYLVPPPAHVSNLHHTGPLAFPAGVVEPFCVTWNSAAGSVFGPYAASVMWWPGHTF